MATMNPLARYEAAKAALAAAKNLDEVREHLAGAEAMRAYARISKDRQMEMDAVELRFLAQRRVGELMEVQRTTVGLGKPGPKIGVTETPISLSEAGIDKNLAKKARAAAAIPEDELDNTIAEIREAVATYAGRATSRIEKTDRRAAREHEWGDRTLALPNGAYGVILADPEWRFETYGPGGMDRAAANHYRTSLTEVIMNRPVGDIAADDCILFLWATAPMLVEALAVMAAWGFTYKSQAVWVKDRAGTGYWFRNQHEILLVGTKGNPVPPAPGQQYSSVLEFPVGAHSEKPEAVQKMIEVLWPNVPKIELNRRGRARPGWSAWGDEVD